MVRIVNNDIEIVYEWELLLAPMPRSVLLLAGLGLLAAATIGALVGVAQPGLLPYPARDLHAICALAGAAGLLLTWRATRAPRHRMSSVTIGDAGITFRWRPDHPHGTPPGPVQDHFVPWADMDPIEWTEEGLEHEFKQVLCVTLARPVVGGQRRFRFLICDTRSHRECQTLHAKLPRHAPRPGSLMDALKSS